MSVFTTVSTASRTAHRPFGHRGSIGFAPMHTTDRQAEAVAELLAERARRAAHLNCERRPFSIDRELT